MIKAIFFDQDETLIHPSTGLYEKYVLERARDFAKVFGIADLEEAKKKAFLYKINECNSSTITLYDKIGVSRDVWYDKMNKIDVNPFIKQNPNLIKFLNALKKLNLLLILLTNSPTLQTKKIISAAGMKDDTFDETFTWEKGREPPKPSKKPFVDVTGKYGLLPEECLMVGNEIDVDLNTAHSMGIKTVGINLETAADSRVDFVIDDLWEIIEILKIITKYEKDTNWGNGVNGRCSIEK